MKISESTSMSLGVAILLAGVVAAGVRLEGRIDAAQANADDAKADKKILISIDKRLTRIEGKLGVGSRED